MVLSPSIVGEEESYSPVEEADGSALPLLVALVVSDAVADTGFPRDQVYNVVSTTEVAGSDEALTRTSGPYQCVVLQNTMNRRPCLPGLMYFGTSHLPLP